MNIQLLPSIFDITKRKIAFSIYVCTNIFISSPREYLLLRREPPSDGQQQQLGTNGVDHILMKTKAERDFNQDGLIEKSIS